MLLDCVCSTVSEEAVSRSVRGGQQNETERIAHKQRMQTAVVIRRTLSRAVVGSITHTGTPAGGSHKQSPVVTLAYIFFCDSGSRISTCQSKKITKTQTKEKKRKKNIAVRHRVHHSKQSLLPIFESRASASDCYDRRTCHLSHLTVCTRSARIDG